MGRLSPTGGEWLSKGAPCLTDSPLGILSVMLSVAEEDDPVCGCRVDYTGPYMCEEEEPKKGNPPKTATSNET